MTRTHRIVGLFIVVGTVVLPAAHAAQTDATPMNGAMSQSAPAVAASPLDGTEWPVKVIPTALAKEHGAQAFDDAFVFAKGQVTLTACEKSGFAPSAYIASQTSPDAWTVTTQQESPTAGKTAWTAMIKADTITGKLVMTKKDGAIEHYTFEGKRAVNKPS